jgi:H(+)-translocating pyrophosphatase
MIQRRTSAKDDATHDSSPVSVVVGRDVESGGMDKLIPRTITTYKLGLPSFLDPRWVTTKSLVPVAGMSAAVAALALLFLDNIKYFILIWAICIIGFCFCLWLFAWCLNKDTGTESMLSVANPIREGAESFLSVQYQYIMQMSGLVMLFIFCSYKLRDGHAKSNEHAPVGIDALGTTMLGFIAVVSFIIGALCSGFAGYAAMWVAAQANVRVASAAQRSFNEALQVCFRSGAFAAVLVISLCVGGISLLFGICILLFGAHVPLSDTPLLIVGYGFGASFVALFMQLGGGIYTKAADVGADLVGKVEVGIPEDDARNPAVIADLVGDMVGDCVGSSADLFESVAAEIIGAMILGGVLAKESKMENPLPFIIFPVVVHAFDIVVSSIGILSVRASGDDTDPMRPMNRGYIVSVVLAFVFFGISTRWLLYFDHAPSAWLHFLFCGIVGMITSYIFVLSTQYYTDYKYPPVREIAKASLTGHGTNIITGVSVGMKSTVVPVIAVSVGVISSYWLGHTSGIGHGHNAGLLGNAVATMGMLSNAVYILAMNNFGPIADNAGGIAEMSSQPESVRHVTDQV